MVMIKYETENEFNVVDASKISGFFYERIVDLDRAGVVYHTSAFILDGSKVKLDGMEKNGELDDNAKFILAIKKAMKERV